MKYQVYCEDVNSPEYCWGWTQDHKLTKAEIQQEKDENPTREISVTWTEVENFSNTWTEVEE